MKTKQCEHCTKTFEVTKNQRLRCFCSMSCRFQSQEIWYTHPSTNIKARNLFTIDGDVVTMEVTQGQVTTFDLEDLEKVAEHPWYVCHGGKTSYAQTSIGFGRGNRKLLQLHRLIAGENGKPVDHKNGCGLDNRKSNLRSCSNSENTRNQSLRKDNTTGYKGVSYRKQRGKYRACIEINSRHKHLGHFNCPTAAAIAYDKAAIEHFGEFARLNLLKHPIKIPAVPIGNQDEKHPELLFQTHS